MIFPKKAQGSTEYLLLLGAAALISIFILTIIIQLTEPSTEQAVQNAATALCRSRLDCSGTVTIDEFVFECNSDEITCTAEPETPAGPICGNDVCEPGEDNQTCQQDCFCGNETCDVDETQSTCPLDCGVPPECGNGIIEQPEQCDDENQENGDGCSDSCNIEQNLPPGEEWDCSDNPQACIVFLSQCKTSDWKENTIYRLTSDLVLGSTCIEIANTDNVSLDCDGFLVDNDGIKDPAIKISSSDNVIINNCHATTSTSPVMPAILVEGTSENTSIIDSSTCFDDMQQVAPTITITSFNPQGLGTGTSCRLDQCSEAIPGTICTDLDFDGQQDDCQEVCTTGFTQCSDGLDNDSDGYCDAEGLLCTDGSIPGDPGCINGNDDTEEFIETEAAYFTEQELIDNFDSQFFSQATQTQIMNLPVQPAGFGGSGMGWVLMSALEMYEATQDQTYMDWALDYVEFTITLLNDDFPEGGDGFLEWEFDCLDMRKYLKEAISMVRIIKSNPSLDQAYGTREDDIFDTLVDNVVHNPRTGCEKPQNWSQVQHIMSHDARIYTDIYLITNDQSYLDTALGWFNEMKTSLFVHPEDVQTGVPEQVIWGHVDCQLVNRDYPFCYDQPAMCFDFPGGQNFCNPSDSEHSRDTFHQYIQFYRLGLVDEETLLKLSATFKRGTWNREIENGIRFHDFIDGRIYDDPINGGGTPWEFSNSVRAGYPELSVFDPDIKRIVFNHLEFGTDPGDNLVKLNTYSSLLRSKKIGTCTYNMDSRAVEVCGNGQDDDCDGFFDDEDLGGCVP